jgi:hypothetical protein
MQEIRNISEWKQLMYIPPVLYVVIRVRVSVCVCVCVCVCACACAGEPTQRCVFPFNEPFVFILREEKQMNILRTENVLEPVFSAESEFDFIFKISRYEYRWCSGLARCIVFWLCDNIPEEHAASKVKPKMHCIPPKFC